jgi:hypothetical protein
VYVVSAASAGFSSLFALEGRWSPQTNWLAKDVLAAAEDVLAACAGSLACWLACFVV